MGTVDFALASLKRVGQKLLEILKHFLVVAEES
jgi:hypothetical protein